MAIHPSDLNLRHLRAVVAVAEIGSITGAGERIGLSQPALTQGLSKLEKQIGYGLFERRSEGMVVTPAGRLMVERIEAALEHLTVAIKGLARHLSSPDQAMTMTQMRAFLALAETGSFAAAATSSGMSHSAVHRAVGDLEQSIGRELVERRGRNVVLKRGGGKLARGIRLALGELAGAIAELGLETEGELIAFGALPLSRPFLAPTAMGRLWQEQPRARFEVTEGSWRELVEPLRDGRIDLIVGALRPFDFTDLHQVALYEDRLVIACGSQHPLAGNEAASLDSLARFRWIVPPANTPLRLVWEQMFSGSELPSMPIECGSVMIIGRLLTEGDFLTLLSPDQIALQTRLGLLSQVGIPLEEGTRIVGITTRRSWRPTSTQRRFIDLLREIGRTSEARYSAACQNGVA